MSRARRAGLGLVVVSGLLGGGCVRGCSEPAPRDAATPPGATPTAATPALRATRDDAAPSLPDALEATLSIRLPDAAAGDRPVPAIATHPRRRLLAFAPDRHLCVLLQANGRALRDGRDSLAADADEPTTRAWLRTVASDYEARAGVAANRLVLLTDAAASPQRLDLLRRAAQSARSWRVVTLARQGEVLFEVSLDPPPAQRPRAR